MRFPAFVSLFVIWIAIPVNAEVPPKTLKLRQEMNARLAKGKTTDADEAHCRTWIAELGDPSARQPFALLLSQHLRLKNLRAHEAVEPLLPFLLKPADVDKWQEENAVLKLRKAETNGEAASDKLSQRPEIPGLPSPAHWLLTDETAVVAIEIARCLCVLEQPREGLEIVDYIGQKFANENRVIAAECAADIFIWMKMYDNAVGSYRYGMEVLGSLKKEERSAFFSDDDRRSIKKRLENKLRGAQVLWDEERFDPAWLVYRQAREAHVNGKAYCDALCLYRQVIDEFPKSMVAEASKCYQVECLTLLADKANLANTAERFRELRVELSAAKEAWQLSKQYGEPPGMVKWRRDRMRFLEKLLETWKTIPTGAAALREAEKRADAMLEENMYGLYRGEALLTIGLAHLTISLDPDKALPWLTRAEKWFSEIDKTDQNLNAFELPERVRKVATPPKNERFTDRWKNVRMSRPRPADLFNRRTCDWYLNAKRKELALARGLIAFAQNDQSAAKKHWDKLAVLDKEFYAEQAQAGWANATTYYRLMQRLQHQGESLYARPEEMAAFVHPQRRLLVLVADLFYLSEEPQKAYSLYKMLESGRLGKLSYNEKAYVAYAIFSCACWNKNIDEVAYIEPMLKHFIGTPSESRALLGYANRLNTALGMEVKEKKIGVYEYIVQKHPQTEEAEYAAFVLGMLYFNRAQLAQQQRNSPEMLAYLRKISDLYTSRLQGNLAGPYKSDMEKVLSTIKPYLGKVNS